MRPTYRQIETGSLVFPEGYLAKDLELLPENFWETWDLEQALIALRKKRDKLLEESDKFMLLDIPITEAKKSEWVVYRQFLRDLPETGNIQNPEWPTKPE